MQARAERGPSAAFIGVLGTPILCVYSGGLNLVPHLARLAFTVRKSRAERSAKCTAVFGTPFGILSVYSENEPALGPAFFSTVNGVLESCLNPKLHAVCDALLHWTDHTQMPHTGCNPPMRFRVQYFVDLNFKHDSKCT